MGIIKQTRILSLVTLLSCASYMPLNCYAPNLDETSNYSKDSKFLSYLESTALENSNLNLPIIAIDPGHDSKYNGCRVKDLKEEVLTLDVSKKLDSLMVSDNYPVFLTRQNNSKVNKDSLDLNNDKRVSLTDELTARANYIKDNCADYALIIHYNKCIQSKAVNGVEIYFYGIRSKNDLNNNKIDINFPKNCKIYSDKSKQFAQKLSSYFDQSNIEHKILGADMNLLSQSPAKVTVLIELGYLSNPIDFDNAKTEEGRLNSATMLANFFRDNKEYLKELIVK